VECARSQEAVSARLDGELDPEESAALDVHLAGCADCRLAEARLVRVHRLVRVRQAPAVPDLTQAILSRYRPPSPGRGEWVRYGLAAVALTELVLAVPLLVGAGGDAVHDTRHVGSLSAALAVGLLYAAWKPVRAFALVPIAAVLAVCMAVTAVLDIASGDAAAVGEAHHLLDVAGLVLLWLLAGRPLPRRRPTGGRLGRVDARPL
jgi:predicted anti-sigma-YlaC factor YlaD